MKSSRCVLILIYLINHIVSVNTTNKFNLNLLVVLTDTIWLIS